MSHEINTNDQVILGSNTPAWHGLGKVYQGLLSARRVYLDGVGAKEIVEVPVYADGLVVPGAKGLIAHHQNGNRTALAACSRSYGVLQDSAFFEILETVYDGRAVVETAGTLRNGRRIWALVKRESWEVTAGDFIASFDLWVNRHDGSGCFELHGTSTRVVCANTWRMALQGSQRTIGVRHTSNVEMLAKAAAATLKTSREGEETARNQVRALANKPITKDAAVDVYTRALGYDIDQPLKTSQANRLDALAGLFTNGTGNEGRTAWDAFNAVTEYVDHRRDYKTGERRFEGALFGAGDDLKAKTFDLLAAL